MEEFVQRIVTERTLEIGTAKMSEGNEAYIRFQIGPLVGNGTVISNECWMYARLVKLSDKTAWFVFKGRKNTGLKLCPETILEITDKCPTSDPQDFLDNTLIRIENTGKSKE